MNIKSLQLTNFRNYRQQALNFIDGTNIIYGANAQGKTNLLEAVFLFCSGRSHRSANDRELMLEGSDFAVVKVDFNNGSRDLSGVLKISEGKRKDISINGVKVGKVSHIANYINAVMFAPQDLSMVKEGPSERRRFMDMAISQIKPAYISCLSDYTKALTQRNNLLKDRRMLSANTAVMQVWEEKIAELSARITVYRHSFCDLLFAAAADIHYDISGENLRCRYAANSGDHAENAADIRCCLLKKLDENRRRDIETGVTSVGAHRDDIEFTVDSRDVRRFGSQGQQRSVVLSLKLAQTEIIKTLKNSYPVILLDDIMSELDSTRRSYLAGRIKDKQVIITCTDKQAACACGQVKYFFVQNGAAREES